MIDTGHLPLTREALVWFRQGLAAASQDKYEDAIACFDRVLQTHPDFYEAWFERGLVLEALGHYVQAISSFDHALNQFPPAEISGQVWSERGNALQYGLGKYTEAIVCYDQALKLTPDNELVWQNRGNALLYGLSRSEDALACYERTLQINPANYVAWRNRGNALIELRRYDEAIASYEQALEINPEDDVAWHARILASERAGLTYQLPATRRAPGNTSFEKPTFIESDLTSGFYSPYETTLIEQEQQHLQYLVLVIEDDWGRRELILENDQYVLGRDPEGDIQLHSQFVSRQHATLTRFSNADGHCGYRIVDGNPNGKPSTNGILINGRKVAAKDLAPGDAIILGPGVSLSFCCRDTSESLS